MSLRIDSHQHFWAVSRGDYHWMANAGREPMRRDFGPAELRPMLQRAGLDRTVLVQAAATLAETHYMLGIADATDFVARVVGWVDFENRDDLGHLEKLARHPKFAGVRPMIEDIADPDWMLRDDIAWAFAAICDLDLTFDALGFPLHCDNFMRLKDRYPGMRVVLDHCLKPRIRDGALADWAAGMARLAEGTDACCKLSGLATEALPGWGQATLAPYAEHVLKVFGARRVMFGSDWPVLELNGSYEDWYMAAAALVPKEDHAEVFGGTAARFYRIG